jgi:hypothetical protein
MAAKRPRTLIPVGRATGGDHAQAHRDRARTEHGSSQRRFENESSARHLPSRTNLNYQT